MKIVRYIFALCAFLFVSQAAYGMYYEHKQLPNGVVILQQVPDEYLIYPIYQPLMYLPYSPYQTYPMAPQNIGFPIFPAGSKLSENVQLDETDTGIKSFFQEIIGDKEISSFAQSLLLNARDNDAIQLVTKGAQYRSELKPVEKKAKSPIVILRRAANLNKKAFQSYLKNYHKGVKTRIEELFCKPLEGNNLIKLSDFAYNTLCLSEDEVEIICILSLAFFTSFRVFNGIDRLRWAVKKNLWNLTEKTLKEGIHPNWVVERGRVTALRRSEMNGNYFIRKLLLSINGIDTTYYENQESYEQICDSGYANGITE